MRSTLPSRRTGFTLIELLIVIAIVAVLAVTVILTLNPADLLKQTRDSDRLTDLYALNKALTLIQGDVSSATFGTTTTVYVSVPDSSTSCANLGLPSLPSGYTYGCAPTSTLRNTNGTGWIPVNFNLISSGSPLSALPLDPINTTSSGNYYTYIPGGSWELSARPESAKYLDKAAVDGGVYPTHFEVGMNTLLPMAPNNLLGSQNNFASAPWGQTYSGNDPSTPLTVTTDYTTGPNGVAGADRLNRTTAFTSDARYLYQNIPFISGSRYKLSVWLKSNTGSSQSVTLSACCAAGNFQTVSTVTTDWNVFSVDFTAQSTVSMEARPVLHFAPGTLDISVWGAQLIRL